MKIQKDKIKEFVTSTIGLNLFDYQIDFIADCFEHQNIISCWSRQIGKSTSCALFACLYAVLNASKTIIIVAHSDRQSKEMYRKVLGFAHRVKEFKQSITKETIEETVFKNGSRILCLPTGTDGSFIRGYTCDVLIEDECAFISDQINDDVLEPFLSTKKDGKLIKLSTPKGKIGHFYRSYISSHFKVHHYTWRRGTEAGLISEDYIKRKQVEMDSLSFSQEYEAEFVDEASCYFPSSLLTPAIDSNISLLSDVSTIPTGTYYLGYDPSRYGKDEAAAVIVKKGKDEDPHKVVYVNSVKKSSLDKQGDWIEMLNKQFKFSKIFIDETGLGSGLCDILIKKFNIGKVEKVKGITFTNKSKKDIYSNLRTLFENKQLLLPAHEKMLIQLKNLQYEYSDSGVLKIFHPPNQHDDYPDALSLAAQGLRCREHAFFIHHYDDWGEPQKESKNTIQRLPEGQRNEFTIGSI